MNVLVTGVGIICALGNSPDEVVAAFRQHCSGMGRARHLRTRHQASYTFGEVNCSNEELAAQLGLPAHLSRTILLSYHAARQAYSAIPAAALAQSRVGFISATSVGGMDKTESFFESYLTDSASGDLRQVVNHDCGKSTDYVARQLGIKDFVTTISTACSSSANAIMLGARMIKSGLLDVVVAGGSDPLTRFTLNGFNTLMIVDPEQCRPLNASREGLNLGEGAAYVVLMSERLAASSQAPAMCRLSGYSNTNDAFHQTALSDEGEGPYLAMAQALAASGLQPTDIGYINMHGTGTQNNDAAEGTAIRRLFGEACPKLSSTKSFTGHTLAASGAIEAVLSALSLQQGYVYPNFSFSEPVPGPDLRPETEFHIDSSLQHVLSNSFGFGGNCSSLIFSRT
ncbi:beta-ketoacyl-[acyl-carrier-protein] synthase family protein [Hymenobacter saemangeumensis]|uniref:Beta-ketoacyl-[acyl-carrier-protein] synthase family protein n=1 Tax=Hymenobacter saemangeumensis TaxID=1084522 RepID=A0ABP8ITC2_9BACT